jgi:4-amino-4-deoxy-L-arabinose transferase-like glycosyltransferase
MFISLPLLCLINIFLIINRHRTNWRESLILSTTYWGVLLAVITEILSYFKLITFVWILVVWVVTCIILICTNYRINSKIVHISKSNNSSQINETKSTYSLKSLLFGIIFYVVAVGLIAIIAPPNNWDSMDYHMSRVAHWIQNHSVAHYPTSYTPQLYQNPWSEFVILHFQILSGGDYFANLVQWLSMIGCIIAVSLIAKQLGADLRGQVFSAVVAATIPMGILQASSTQNDYVVAFWVVCLAYYVLLTVQANKNSNLTNNYFQVGSSIGLAILSKGTAYFYIFPFFLWLCFYQIKRLRWQVWKPALMIGSISLSLNIGHYLRNYNLFASPLGEPSSYRNEILGINTLFSNILRNLALHIGTPIGLWNGIANKLIQIIHIFIGLDVDDPRITFSRTFFVPGGWSTVGIPGNENSAGNLIHLILIIICITVFITQPNIRKQSYILPYVVTVISTFFIFCYLVKWQAWNSRLHLPFFVLMSPFAGVILSKIKKDKIAFFIITFLLISSLSWVFFNRYRPIIANSTILKISRIEQYFSNRPYLKETYTGAVEFLNSEKCSNIGLSMGNDPWEYPLWVIWQQNKQERIQIQHINVNNISALREKEYPYKEFIPCGIISMETKRSKQEKRQEISFKNKIYVRVWDSPDLGVFTKK